MSALAGTSGGPITADDVASLRRLGRPITADDVLAIRTRRTRGAGGGSPDSQPYTPPDFAAAGVRLDPSAPMGVEGAAPASRNVDPNGWAGILGNIAQLSQASGYRRSGYDPMSGVEAGMLDAGEASGGLLGAAGAAASQIGGMTGSETLKGLGGAAQDAGYQVGQGYGSARTALNLDEGGAMFTASRMAPLMAGSIGATMIGGPLAGGAVMGAQQAGSTYNRTGSGLAAAASGGLGLAGALPVFGQMSKLPFVAQMAEKVGAENAIGAVFKEGAIRAVQKYGVRGATPAIVAKEAMDAGASGFSMAGQNLGNEMIVGAAGGESHVDGEQFIHDLAIGALTHMAFRGVESVGHAPEAMGAERGFQARDSARAFDDFASSMQRGRDQGQRIEDVAAAPTLEQAQMREAATASDLRRLPFSELKARAADLGIDDPGESKGLLVPRVLEAMRGEERATDVPTDPERLTNPPEKSESVDAPKVSTEANLKATPFKDLLARAEELGIENPGESKGKLIPRILDAEEQRRATAEPGETNQPSKTSGDSAESQAGGPLSGETPETRPPEPRQGVADRIISAADRWEARAKASYAESQLPRSNRRGQRSGGTTLYADTLHVAQVGAARAIRAGAKGAKAVGRIVDATIAEMAPHMKENAEAIRRAAHKYVRGAMEEGKVNPERLEAVIEASIPKGRKVNAGKQAREATGVADTSPRVETTEAKALRRRMSDRQSVANAAYREGVRTGRIKERADNAPGPLSTKQQINQSTGVKRVEPMVSEKKAMTAAMRKAQSAALGADRVARREERASAKVRIEKKIDQLKDEARNKQAVREGSRKFARKMAKKYVPLADREKVYAVVNSATSPAGIARALRMIRLEMHRSEGKTSSRQLDRLTSDGRMSKLDGDRRARIKLATAGFTQIRDKLRTGTASEAGDASQRIRGVLQDVRGIYAEHRVENKLLAIAKAADVKTVRDELKTSLGKLKELKRGDIPGEVKDRKANIFRRSLGGLRGLTGIAKTIDGGTGWAKKLLVDSINRGDSRRAEMKFEALDAIDRIAKETGAFKSLDHARERTSGIRGRASTETVDVQLGPYKKISKGQAMYVLAMDSDARARLDSGAEGVFASDLGSGGFKLDDAKRREIESKLSPAEKEFVRRVKKEVIEGILRQPMFDAIRRMRGYEPEAIPDYFGIRVAHQLSDLAEPTSLLPHGGGLTPFLQNAGITRAREGGGKFLMIGDFLDQVTSHADLSSRIAHMAEPIWDVRKTILQGQVAQEIKNRLGDPVLQRIEKSMTLIGNGTITPAKQGYLQRGLRVVNGLRARALTAFSTRSWAKQAWGSTMLLTEMNPVDVSRATASALSGKSLDRLMELRPWFRERYGEAGHTVISGVPDPEGKAPIRDSIMAAARDAKHLHGGDFLRNVGRAADGISRAQWADAIPARIAFEAAKHEAKRRFPSLSESAREQWAAKRAEEVFRKTMNTYGATDSNGLALSAKDDSVVQAFNSFQGDQAKKFMLLDDALREKDWKRALRVATVIAVNNAGAAAISGGMLYAEITIGAALTGNTAGVEWAKRKAWETATGSFIRDTLGITFGLDRIYSLFAGPGGGGSLMDMPTAGAVTKMFGGFKETALALKDMAEEGKEPTPAQRKAVERLHAGLEKALVGGAGLTGNVLESPYYSVKHIYQGATRTHVDDLRDMRSELAKVPKAQMTPEQRRTMGILNVWSSANGDISEAQNGFRKHGNAAQISKLESRREALAEQFKRRLRDRETATSK